MPLHLTKPPAYPNDSLNIIVNETDKITVLRDTGNWVHLLVHFKIDCF